MSAHLLEVPVTSPDVWDEATHECGGCGRPLRLAHDRNWPLHGCQRGGRRLAKGFVTRYRSEEEMRSDPAKFDAAEWEFIQTVVVPNRKPLSEPALPVREGMNRSQRRRQARRRHMRANRALRRIRHFLSLQAFLREYR
jgi:hypothetical protein